MSLFGASIRRKEDPRLLRGNGRYVSDVKLHGMVHAVFIRSPHAHALIRGIDVSVAIADPRVVCVLTAAELPQDLPPLPCIDAEETTKPFNQPILATEKVRYVGEPVAVLVVEGDRYVAEDIAGNIDVDYEPLPAVASATAAMAPEAPVVHFESNIVDVLKYSVGDVESALAGAPHTLSERFVTQRYAGTPLETRGVIVQWDEARNGLTMWSSTQVPHSLKSTLVGYLGLAENAVRVIAPDVGGAFGVKLQPYPEEIVLGLVAERVGRPIKWVEDRYEHFLASTHGREQYHDVEVGYDDDGRILAIRDHAVTNTGAYLQRLTLVEPFIGVSMLSGPYNIEHQQLVSSIVMTNTTPLNPFRGVGHVQAAFTMERIIDLVAAAVGADPGEVRKRNMFTAGVFPLHRGIGNVLAGEIIYDSGDYQECLNRALVASEWEDFRREQQRARAKGRHLGIGIGFFVEETALGPFESGRVRVEPSGQVVVFTGACSSGQGHDTVLAQITADELGVEFDDITVVHGDTDLVASGVGTYASRSAPVGGTAVRHAAGSIKEQAIKIGAEMLEASPQDLEVGDGEVRVKGSPASSVPLAQVAARVAPGQPLPEGVDGYTLDATDVYHPETNTFSYGCHIATVEVDIETGVVTLLRHVVVNDSGTLINPLLVEGQVQGGVALGVGGALLEEIAYRDDGQPLNANFMDYLIPAIGNMPEMIVEHMVVPTPLNPDGMKGAGEGGAVGAPAAIANAVADALHPLGVKITETPLGPGAIHRAIQDAGRLTNS
ncbi:xanthine dehydrogenase family protein molybdopterin-binding subunit [Candidatus Poriferisocius sp.]|uniref:xanthine dehydrogenase family protein molybdopterin-binding subunit n=1 Tax=Candidatus Poriferisocius sp. TaxID=3101276 RepID=UPI003B5AA199